MSVPFTLQHPTESAPWVNYSNTNARAVLAALGLDAEGLALASKDCD